MSERCADGYLGCHCGQPVHYGFDGNPAHHRGMCQRCDARRCDVDPAACNPGVPRPHESGHEERLTIFANSDVSRGKYAAAAVHAALYHYGIAHGSVIVLGARPGQIEDQCELVIRDAGRTEVKPGTVTAGVRR